MLLLFGTLVGQSQHFSDGGFLEFSRQRLGQLGRLEASLAKPAARREIATHGRFAADTDSTCLNSKGCLCQQDSILATKHGRIRHIKQFRMLIKFHHRLGQSF